MNHLVYVTYELAQLRSAVTATRIGDKAVGDVAPADVRALLATEAGRPSVARHRFGALSRFFDWCHDEGRLAVNPCTLIAKARRPRATTARAHFLAPAEIARLWRAAGETEAIAPVHRDFARFLMAVPCRRGEAARMDWSQLDLDAGVWSQPGKLTKNRDPHRLHLHTLALGILRERHDAAGRPKGGRVPLAPV
jgi:integrase